MAKGKKGKKSKAQEEAERLQREDEERKAAEGQLRKQEEDRITNEEKAKKLRELRAYNRQKELERVKDEVESTAEAIANEEKALNEVVAEDGKQTEWKKYVECNPRPDPELENELNTYISTWGDEKEIELEGALQSCQYTEGINDDLIDLLSRMEAANNLPKVQFCKTSLQRLWKAMNSKLDHSTAQILQHADELTKADSKNEVLMSTSVADIKFGLWVNIVTKVFRVKTIRWPEIGIGVDVPKALALVKIALRVLYFSYDHELYSRKCRDRAVGGIFCIELLQLPEPPKRVKGWTLRVSNELSDDVSRVSYPVHEGSHAVAGVAAALKIQYTLPSNVLVPDNLRVAWWDEQGETWNEEGITDIDYHPENRSLLFHSVRLCSLAVIQERHIELPYQQWSLKPSKEWPELEAIFTLETKNGWEVQIAVRENECQLLKPENPELAELRATAMPPGLLLHKLMRSGICILPSDEMAKDVDVTLKCESLEAKLGYEISQIATGFDIESSVHNQSSHVAAEEAVFRFRETTAFSDDPDPVEFKAVFMEVDKEIPNWKHRYCPVADGVKSSIVNSDEREPFRVDPHDNRGNTCYYSKSCLQAISTEEAKERMFASSVRFKQTVQELFHLVRPFSFG